MTSRRKLIPLLSLVAFMASVVGCAGSNLSFPKAFSRSSDVETVSTKPAPRGNASDDADRNSPFLDRPDHKVATDRKLAPDHNLVPETNAAESTTNKVIQTAGAAGTSTASPRSMSDGEATLRSRLSPEMFARVQDEFQNSTAEHREYWYEILNEVTPEMVPQLLLVHRAANERRDNAGSAPLATASAAGPPAADFLSYPPAGPPPSTAVRPGMPASPAPHPLGPQVTPGATIVRPMVEPAHPMAQPQQPLAGREPGQPLANPVAAAPVANGTKISAVETAAQENAVWPPNDGVDLAKPRTGFIEVPQDMAVRQASATQLADDGKYALANDWDSQLRRLIDMIERNLASPAAADSEDAKARQAELQVYLRMLYLMDGQQTRSLQAVPDIPPTHQEFWTQMFWGMTNYFDRKGISDPSHRATETITQLRAAIERLKPESRLHLRNASFSHKINSFGDYEQFDRDEFEAGQPVLVYVEVQNFASEMGSEGLYKTRLRSTIEIHKAGRGPESGLAHSQDYPATEDTCRNLRQDYFHSYRIDLPEDLTPGPHVLKLMVEDEVSQRIATVSLSFVVR